MFCNSAMISGEGMESYGFPATVSDLFLCQAEWDNQCKLLGSNKAWSYPQRFHFHVRSNIKTSVFPSHPHHLEKINPTRYSNSTDQPTNKQTNKHYTKQSNTVQDRQTNRQTNKQTNKRRTRQEQNKQTNPPPGTQRLAFPFGCHRLRVLSGLFFHTERLDHTLNGRGKNQLTILR